MTVALVAAVVAAVIIGVAMESFSAVVVAALIGGGIVFGGNALITYGALAGLITGLTLAGALAVGTAGFWLLVAVSTVALACLVENEEGAWATGTLLLTLLLLQLFGDIKVFTSAYNHPLVALMCVAGYFMAGMAWAIWKWVLYNRDQKMLYDERRTAFLKDNNITDNTIPADLKTNFDQCVNGIDIRPPVTEHKERVLRWMTYWPWSALAWLLSDPIRRLFREIYHQIQNTLQKISDRIWQGVENDLPPPATSRRRRNQH
ncbi:MAG: hypothetical protein HZB99_00600 [Candidatus Harrisonbacteria bacterium]|nr:hypothetical protein [Candidatus Harrisonbacteria bacterium]